jgi:transposase
MVQVADHLGVAELQAGWRESKDATLARHYQVIWLLAEGRSCAEVARLTGFVRRWVEELVARYNRFGPSSLGDRRRGNGAKPKILTPEVLAMLRERVKTPPDDGGVWTAKKVAAVIAAALGRAAGRRAARLGGAAGDRLDDPAPAAATCAGGDARGAGGV